MEKTEIQVTFNEKALIAFSKFVRKTHVKTFFGNIGLFLTLSFVGFCLGIVGFIFSINYSFILQLLSIALLLVGGFYFFKISRMVFTAFGMFKKLGVNLNEWKKNQKNPPEVKLILQGNFLLYENERTDKTNELRIDEQNLFLLEVFEQGLVVNTFDGSLTIVKESMSASDYQKVVAHLRMIREKAPEAI